MSRSPLTHKYPSRRDVGFWAPSNTSQLAQGLAAALGRDPLPLVEDHIDPHWDSLERRIVLAYVTNQRFRGMAYMGYSTCRVCGTQNGNRDFMDKVYRWPEGLGHYIEAHDVRPPQHFIDHVLGKR